MENKKIYCEYDLNLTEEQYGKLTKLLSTNPWGYTEGIHYINEVIVGERYKVTHKFCYRNNIYLAVRYSQEITKIIDYRDRVVVKLTANTRCPGKSLWFRHGKRPDYHFPIDIMDLLFGEIEYKSGKLLQSLIQHHKTLRVA